MIKVCQKGSFTQSQHMEIGVWSVFSWKKVRSPSKFLHRATALLETQNEAASSSQSGQVTRTRHEQYPRPRVVRMCVISTEKFEPGRDYQYNRAITTTTTTSKSLHFCGRYHTDTANIMYNRRYSSPAAMPTLPYQGELPRPPLPTDAAASLSRPLRIPCTPSFYHYQPCSRRACAS